MTCKGRCQWSFLTGAWQFSQGACIYKPLTLLLKYELILKDYEIHIFAKLAKNDLPIPLRVPEIHCKPRSCQEGGTWHTWLPSHLGFVFYQVWPHVNFSHARGSSVRTEKSCGLGIFIWYTGCYTVCWHLWTDWIIWWSSLQPLYPSLYHVLNRGKETPAYID